MEYFNEILGFLSEREFSVPLWEIMLYVTFISFCLLMGRFRLGLMGSYCFVFYWGFLSNMTHFINMFGEYTWGMPVYVFSGLSMFVIAIIGFFFQED